MLVTVFCERWGGSAPGHYGLSPFTRTGCLPTFYSWLLQAIPRGAGQIGILLIECSFQERGSTQYAAPWSQLEAGPQLFPKKGTRKKTNSRHVQSVGALSLRLPRHHLWEPFQEVWTAPSRVTTPHSVIVRDGNVSLTEHWKFEQLDQHWSGVWKHGSTNRMLRVLKFPCLTVATLVPSRVFRRINEGYEFQFSALQELTTFTSDNQSTSPLTYNFYTSRINSHPQSCAPHFPLLPSSSRSH